MAISDPQYLAQYFQIQVSSSSLGNTATQLCSYDPRRVYLQFSNSSPTTCLVSTLSNLVASGTNGIPIQSNAIPYQLPFSDCGGLVQQVWYGSSLLATGVLMTVSVIYTPPTAGDE